MRAFCNLPKTGALRRLSAGTMELLVAPECGARIAALRSGGRDLLRPASGEALSTAFAYGFSAFPLLPYSGPIFGGGYTFDGVRYELSRNVPAEPDPTHGEGWILPWSVVEQADDRIILSLDYHPSAGFTPFAWCGLIEYKLEPDALVAFITLRNTGNRPMPAGMGFHPYFPKCAGTVLTFAHGRIWPPDEPGAVRREPCKPPAALDFNPGLDVSDMVLDRCYEDWDGCATLRSPDGFLTKIAADQTFRKLQIYDPWDYPYICIEPVSNANDGFNRAALGVPGHGVHVLEAGQAISGRILIGAMSDARGKRE